MSPRTRWALLGTSVVIAAAIWAAIAGPLRPRPVAHAGAIARLTTAFGEVSTRRAGTFTFQPAQDGEALAAGDSVRTGEGARAVVTYEAGGQLHVDPGSLVVVVPQENPSVRALRLESGALAGDLPPGTEGPGQVSVTDRAGDPLARISRVDPGQLLSFRVRMLEEASSTEVSILSGDAEVSRSGRAVRLRSGQAIDLPTAGDPGEPVTLPGFPQLRTPEVDARFDLGAAGAGGTVSLAWEGASGAASYRVQVALQPGAGFDFTSALVLDRTVTGTELSFEPAATGTYAWRAASLDDRGREGEFGFARRFAVDSLPAAEEAVHLVASATGELWSGEPETRVRGEVAFNTGTSVGARPSGSLAVAGAALDLAAGARMKVTELAGNPRALKAGLALDVGDLLVDLPDGAPLQHVQLQAGAAQLGLSAGSRVKVALRAGLARVICERGGVEASAGGRTARLSPGDVVDVGPDGPGARMQVPAPPLALEPAARAQVPPGLVSFSWRAAGTAAHYRLYVIAADGGRVEDRVVSIEQAKVHLAPGSYRWTVTAVDAMGLESAPSVRALEVLAAPPPRPPRITIVTPPAGSTVTATFVELEGRTAPGVRVSVNTKEVQVDPIGTFRARVPLELGSNSIEVSARDPSGRSSQASLRVRREVP